MPIYGPGGAPGVAKSEFEEFKEQIAHRFDRVDEHLDRIELLLQRMDETNRTILKNQAAVVSLLTDQLKPDTSGELQSSG